MWPAEKVEKMDDLARRRAAQQASEIRPLRPDGTLGPDIRERRLNPSPSRVEGEQLGTDATYLVCGLLADHEGDHLFHVRWSDVTMDGPDA